MTPTAASIGSALFLVAAPGFFAVYVPWTITRWRVPPEHLPALTFLGALLILVGGVLLLDCFVRFALQGRGTPAPIAPPERLVVTGAYRFVRNPMYVSLVAFVSGQALVFGDPRVFGYALAVWMMFTTFVLAYEEPALRARFGEDYVRYCAHVRRWWPRVTPWRPD